LCLGNK